MSKKVYVLGHKNPDTDSFCAASAYARLKNRIGEEQVVAGRLGEPSTETRWVYEFWKEQFPEFVADVKLHAKDIMNQDLLVVNNGTSLLEVGEKIRATKNNHAFVCCTEGKPMGIVTLGDLGEFCLEKVTENASATAVDVNAILHQPVSDLMKTELVAIDEEADMEKVKSIVLNHRFRSFPVVSADHKVIGTISRQEIITAKPKQVILVDHNERSQAVSGIDEAEVIEVVDHHRIGDIQTSGPIFFRVEPVGCSCTVVANLYRMYGLEPEPSYAGLMLSAIISDTVLFRSPTCTKEDVRVAEDLAKICGVDLQEYGMQLLGSSSPLTSNTATEVLNTDLKDFKLGNKLLMIGQVMMTDNAKFRERKEELLEEMRATLKKNNADFVGLMCTNILEEATYFLVVGDEEIAEKSFGKKVEAHEVHLPGVLSRKKQIVPPVTKALS
ncbi:hypothetical protein BHU72_06140 [Desulfuribacillus stibiiarsenatis]|uniref:inorganic diphosphatase n=1 Tax=Desulfuribacillus stibiiarsenatis TaxID=1390249 RepID=A0A1E5L4W1_9FIRM|nr:putative manganese-dependent inorganic diphosphatase [Desulfuribacillus stibiiarsenatis]OEH85187.1 hypothetical protein BHU72_06140 [Desulfuribacillus stibiiarsenatis]